MVTDLMLALASFAIAASLILAARPAPNVSLSPHARIAGAIFLVGSALAYAVGSAHLEQLQGLLRGVSALAGLVTALLISKGSSATTAAPATSTSTARISTPPPAAKPSAPSPSPSTSDIEDSLPTAPAETGFLGLVSHELRTPLTAMQLLLDRLADSGDALDPRQRRIIERLGFTADRLTDLIDSLLYYARIQNGRLSTSVEPFDLGTLASEAAEELRPQAQRKALELATVHAKERVSIESDPKLLRLVIVNLVSNAVKFTDKGTVAISAASEGDRRVVRVEDTGRGIAKDEQSRIFQPFQNVEPTKHKHQPGIGLGLSLARQIVQTLGGEITVRSEVGKGSIFELSLPAVAMGRT